MKISLNTIRGLNARYGCTDDIVAIGVDALAQKIGAQLGAIEEVEPIGEKYKGIVIAKVVNCVPHPDSDHMHVCLLDDGGTTPDVNRDENGYVQVVCGAPNVREGLLVAWLPPGTTVPESVDKDPFVLSARELRGVMSNGMIASARELALGDDHSGILEINDPLGEVKAGDDFAEAFELKDDVVFDIENKMFTHRPDCFGFLGISRELAGIQGMPFKSPAWYRIDADIPATEAEALPLTVVNELPELVPRFTAITMRDVAVGPSPTWLVVELAKVGLRSINNIVDYTNFFMLETGQPLHAYDYDKVKALTSGEAAEITVRYPRTGEKVKLLNGKEIEPRAEAIMIASGDHLIGVGGVMGGADTEVSSETKNIIVECATFDMYSIRRTSMAHGLFTDAVTRFNKGQSPLQNRAVLSKIISEIREYASGKVASEIVDVSQVGGREWVHPPVPVSVQFINERLGFGLSADDMKVLLENVEFTVDVADDRLTVTAPFWRTDIETREDVVEEIGRLYGFDKLPLELPVRRIQPAQKDSQLELKNQVREVLARSGANEVLTYSFVHGDLLKKVGQNPDEAFQVSNALSPDLQYYRLSLTPSLLDKVHPNIKAGYDRFALFELGKTHGKSQIDEDGLPKEFDRLAFVYASSPRATPKGTNNTPYYQARHYLVELLQAFGIWGRCTLIPATEADWEGKGFFSEVVRPFNPERSAVIHDGQRILGVVGEFAASTRKALKLPAYSSGFEFGLNLLAQHRKTDSRYVPLPRFPKVMQDITLKVPADLPYQTLRTFVESGVTKAAPEHVLPSLELLDIYQREDDAAHKQITFRLSVVSYEKTLTDAEVTRLLDAVVDAAATEFGAERK